MEIKKTNISPSCGSLAPKNETWKILDDPSEWGADNPGRKGDVTLYGKCIRTQI